MYYFCNTNKEDNDMAQARKYSIGCSGSGWGVWSNETHQKVADCCSRYAALSKWYELEGWKKPAMWY